MRRRPLVEPGTPSAEKPGEASRAGEGVGEKLIRRGKLGCVAQIVELVRQRREGAWRSRGRRGRRSGDRCQCDTGVPSGTPSGPGDAVARLLRAPRLTAVEKARHAAAGDRRRASGFAATARAFQRREGAEQEESEPGSAESPERRSARRGAMLPAWNRPVHRSRTPAQLPRWSRQSQRRRVRSWPWKARL